MLVALVLRRSVEVQQYAVVRLNREHSRHIFLQYYRLLALVDVLGVHLYDIAIGICRVVDLDKQGRVRCVAQRDGELRQSVDCALLDLLYYKVYGVVTIVLLDERSERLLAICSVGWVCLLLYGATCGENVAHLGACAIVAKQERFSLCSCYDECCVRRRDRVVLGLHSDCHQNGTQNKKCFFH